MLHRIIKENEKKNSNFYTTDTFQYDINFLRILIKYFKFSILSYARLYNKNFKKTMKRKWKIKIKKKVNKKCCNLFLKQKHALFIFILLYFSLSLHVKFNPKQKKKKEKHFFIPKLNKNIFFIL